MRAGPIALADVASGAPEFLTNEIGPASGADVARHRLEKPEARVHGVVFRTGGFLGESVRDKAVALGGGEGFEYALRRVEPACFHREAREGDHGIPAPIAEPGIPGDDGRQVLAADGPTDEKCVGRQHQSRKPLVLRPAGPRQKVAPTRDRALLLGRDVHRPGRIKGTEEVPLGRPRAVHIPSARNQKVLSMVEASLAFRAAKDAVVPRRLHRNVGPCIRPEEDAGHPLRKKSEAAGVRQRFDAKVLVAVREVVDGPGGQERRHLEHPPPRPAHTVIQAHPGPVPEKEHVALDRKLTGARHEQRKRFKFKPFGGLKPIGMEPVGVLAGGKIDLAGVGHEAFLNVGEDDASIHGGRERGNPQAVIAPRPAAENRRGRIPPGAVGHQPLGRQGVVHVAEGLGVAVHRGLIAPLQGLGRQGGPSGPRALPWAILFEPFGLC